MPLLTKNSLKLKSSRDNGFDLPRSLFIHFTSACAPGAATKAFKQKSSAAWFLLLYVVDMKFMSLESIFSEAF